MNVNKKNLKTFKKVQLLHHFIMKDLGLVFFFCLFVILITFLRVVFFTP